MISLKAAPIEAKVLEPTGFASQVWVHWFKRLFERVGGNEALSNTELEARLPVGVSMQWFGSAAPDGWMLLNGATIGSEDSGATGRANEDTEDLFTLLWGQLDNTALPIQDSGGSASTRGASAAADFAANKRLPLPNMTGLVPRMTGTQALSGRNKVGPSLGITQEDQTQGHKHGPGGSAVNFRVGGTGDGSASYVGTNSGQSQTDTSTPESDGTNGTPRTGTETRVSAMGVNFIIKL